MKNSKNLLKKIGLYALIRLLVLIVPIGIIILIVELNPPTYSKTRGHTDRYLGVAICAGLWSILVVSFVLIEISFLAFKKYTNSKKFGN